MWMQVHYAVYRRTELLDRRVTSMSNCVPDKHGLAKYPNVTILYVTKRPSVIKKALGDFYTRFEGHQFDLRSPRGEDLPECSSGPWLNKGVTSGLPACWAADEFGHEFIQEALEATYSI